MTTNLIFCFYFLEQMFSELKLHMKILLWYTKEHINKVHFFIFILNQKVSWILVYSLLNFFHIFSVFSSGGHYLRTHDRVVIITICQKVKTQYIVFFYFKLFCVENCFVLMSLPNLTARERRPVGSMQLQGFLLWGSRAEKYFRSM